MPTLRRYRDGFGYETPSDFQVWTSGAGLERGKVRRYANGTGLELIWPNAIDPVGSLTLSPGADPYDQIDVAWTAPPAGTVFDEYVVDIQGGAYGSRTEYWSGTGLATTISGLDEDTLYQVWVYCRINTVAGHGAASGLDGISSSDSLTTATSARVATLNASVTPVVTADLAATFDTPNRNATLNASVTVAVTADFAATNADPAIAATLNASVTPSVTADLAATNVDPNVDATLNASVTVSVTADLAATNVDPGVNATLSASVTLSVTADLAATNVDPTPVPTITNAGHDLGGCGEPNESWVFVNITHTDTGQQVDIQWRIGTGSWSSTQTFAANQAEYTLVNVTEGSSGVNVRAKYAGETVWSDPFGNFGTTCI